MNPCSRCVFETLKGIKELPRQQEHLTLLSPNRILTDEGGENVP